MRGVNTIDLLSDIVVSEVRQYVCAVCQRAFKDPYTMKHHHQTQHLHEYRFRCDVCRRPFDKRSHLQRHKCNPAVTKSFSYRPSSPMKMCSTSLIQSDGDKEKAAKPPKKRCRKAGVYGTKRPASDRSNATADVGGDTCDGDKTPKPDNCVSDSDTNIKSSGVSSAEDVVAKTVGETEEWNSMSDGSDERETIDVLTQATPIESAQGTVDVASDQHDTEEVLGTAVDRSTDNIEEIRSGVVAECVRSASDDQRVVLAYQVTAAKRHSGDRRRTRDQCPPASREGDVVGQQHMSSGQKTPGSILVTFMPADMLKQQHTLRHCDTITTSTTTRYEPDNDLSPRLTSSDNFVDAWSGETGDDNVSNTSARDKINAVVLTNENEPIHVVSNNGAASVDRSSDDVGQLTPSRRSLRQEHRRMLKTRQTQIV